VNNAGCIGKINMDNCKALSLGHKKALINVLPLLPCTSPVKCPAKTVHTCTDSPTIQKPPQNAECQKCDTKQFPSARTTNIWHKRQKAKKKKIK
jgi:hypothetical protein